MKIKKLMSLSFIVIIIVLILNAGNFLIVNEKPIKADVIIGLGGVEIPRADYSIKLYDEGYSNTLLFTGGKNPIVNEKEAYVMRKEAIRLKVPSKNIIVENKSISTYENAIFTKKILMDHNFKSAIIVTSNYHMRRSSLVFNKAFKNTGIKLIFCSAQDINFKPKWWLTNNYSTNIVISEYEKLVGYFFEDRLV